MNEGAETERLFLAFWPDAELRRRVAELSAPAVARARARAVPADNLHVTLVFLGRWPVAAREGVERVVDALTIPGESLTFDRIDHWRRPRILALVAERCPEAVADYQGRMSEGVAALGWTPETRPYRPHVTVGRKTRRGVRRELDQPLAWPCDQVALVRSEPADNGSVYRPIRIWRRRDGH